MNLRELAELVKAEIELDGINVRTVAHLDDRFIEIITTVHPFTDKVVMPPDVFHKGDTAAEIAVAVEAEEIEHRLRQLVIDWLRDDDDPIVVGGDYHGQTFGPDCVPLVDQVPPRPRVGEPGAGE